MGAWGHKSFENDDAMDWAQDFAELGLEAVEGALTEVTSPADAYLETSLCCRAIAAAEVVAALRDGTSGTVPQLITDHILRMPRPRVPQLAQLARTAVDAIARRSELQELWAETPDYGAWCRSVEDLRHRLSR